MLNRAKRQVAAGLAMPTTNAETMSLHLDDLLWVDNAKRDHFDFMRKMRDRGIDVVDATPSTSRAQELIG
jgi:arginine deiminase